MFKLNLIKQYLAILVLTTVSGSASGGLFNAEDYLQYAGGDWDTASAASFVDFSEQTGDPVKFEVGDIVYFYQDFATLGSVTVDGSTGVPGSVFGITAFKATAIVDTSVPFPPQTSRRVELGALGATDFSTFLGTTLGIDVSEVTISADSTFALISSASDVSLSSAGTTDFTSFEADLIAGLNGGFAQGTIASDAFYYGFYDTSITGINDGSAAFNFRYGLNVESDDSTSFQGFGEVTATPFSGSAASVNITTQAATATSAAQSYSGYAGSLSADLLTGNTVPEPNTLLVLSAVGFVGVISRRSRS